MRNLRVVAALLLLSLVAAGCGSRLTPEQRRLVLSGNAAAAAGVESAGGVGAGAAAPGAGGAAAAPAGGGGAGAVNGTPAGGGGGGGGGGAGTPAGTASTGGGGNAAPGGGQGGGGGGGAPQGGGGSGGSSSWQSAPPGGNGGATDTGVTETEITVANVSDISGAVPDLFRDAQIAVQAYFEYFNRTYGGVYGRKLKYLPLDSQLNSSGNRNKYIQACDEAFAAVGSMSAFEQGAKEPISGCKIPDLRTAAVNDEMMGLPTVFPSDASRVGVQPMAEYQYWKKQFPQAVKKSAYLFIDSETTQFQTAQVRDATEKIGYQWPVYRPIPLSQTNYSSYVLEMKRKGVRYVTFQGAYQQAVRLAEYMDQQGFEPDVFALQTNAYTPDYIESGGSVVEGTQIAIPSAILEEIDQNREMQLYAQWLQQIDPNARPTGLGVYAWSVAGLFVEMLKKVGPKLTREALIEQVKKVHSFEGNGLLPEQDIGGKYPADCVIMVAVKGGRFQRIAPASGYTCSKPVKV